MEQIFRLTATEIGYKISTGEVCPEELTKAYIKSIKTHPNSSSIFIDGSSPGIKPYSLIRSKQTFDDQRRPKLNLGRISRV